MVGLHSRTADLHSTTLKPGGSFLAETHCHNDSRLNQATAAHAVWDQWVICQIQNAVGEGSGCASLICDQSDLLS